MRHIGYTLLYIAVLSAALFASCGDKDSAGRVDIARIDLIDPSLQGTEQIDSLERLWAEFMPMLRNVYPDSSGCGVLEVYSKSGAVAYFRNDVAERTGDFGKVESVLGGLFANLSRRLPEVMVPSRVATIITPYNQTVMIGDSVMLIGINHYLGADYPAYEAFPEYLRVNKSMRRLTYDVAEALIQTHYPYEGNGTLLSRMLYEGAVVAAVMEVVPDASLPVALGWDGSQLEWAESNEPRVWQTMVGNDMLFSRDAVAADRLLNPSPASTLINASAPGRIGRYVGYRIVKSYMRSHDEIGLSDMLSPRFYDGENVLLESGYSG